MEGIKQAIEYIASLAVKATKPETVEINGKIYSPRDLKRYDAPQYAEPIKATTLTALVDYVCENHHEMHDHMIVHVVSPAKVLLYSGLTEERKRETLFEVNAQLPQFAYGQEYGQEAFVVAMQACFDKNDDREAVTLMASNIVNTKAAEYSDDGVTQQAVIKSGIASKSTAFVPNPVVLIPYRTFTEVEQPASSFVFRISEGRDGSPGFKLVEADGGAWKREAMQNVADYLLASLDIPTREWLSIIV